MAALLRSVHRWLRRQSSVEEEGGNGVSTEVLQMGVALLTKQPPPGMDNKEIEQEKMRLAEQMGIKTSEVCILQESPLRILRVRYSYSVRYIRSISRTSNYLKGKQARNNTSGNNVHVDITPRSITFGLNA